MHKLLPCLVLVSLIACKGGSVSLTPAAPVIKKQVEFEKMLEASTGDDYVLVKLDTEKKGYAVYQNKDTGKFMAFNLTKLDLATMKTLDDYKAVAVFNEDIVVNLGKKSEYREDGFWQDQYETQYWTEEYYDSDCDCYYTESFSEEVWVGDYWVDTSYTYVWYEGNGFRFSNTGEIPKDFETLAALGEEKSVKLISNKFKLSMNLSEDRSQELGKLYYRWQKLENKRELTDAEMSIFATEALGVSYKDAQKAIIDKIAGDETAYKDLLDKAALVNKTTPEKIGMFLDQLAVE